MLNNMPIVRPPARLAVRPPARLRAAACFVAAALLGSSWASAQPAPAAPATVPSAPAAGDAQHLKVVIQEVVGMVAVSMDGKSWKPAKVGMELDEGASFRTGLKSSVTCAIPPDQVFKLETLGTLTVAQAARQGAKYKTELIMKHGATSYGIEAAGAEHDSTIRTPSSTLAVRGTVVRVADRAPFAPTAESFTGRALFRTAQLETKLGGKNRYARVQSNQGSAAQTALDSSVVDPAGARARSGSDARLISEQVSLGGVLSFDEKANIPVIRGGNGPVSDEQAAASIPGRLGFTLRWTGNSDLNLLVDDAPITVKSIDFGKSLAGRANPPFPANLPDTAYGQIGLVTSAFTPQEILFPGYGLNTTTSGGRIPYDHRGGPKGGQEIAYWPGSFPNGVYGVGVLFASGQETNYKLNAYLDGKPLKMIGFDPEGNLVQFNTLAGSVGAGGSDAAIVMVPGNAYYESVLPELSQAAVKKVLANVTIGGSGASSSSSSPASSSGNVQTTVASSAASAAAERKAQISSRRSNRAAVINGGRIATGAIVAPKGR